MNISQLVGEFIVEARELALRLGHEYITPEHVIYTLCDYEIFKEVFGDCGGEIDILQRNIGSYLEEELEKLEDVEPMESFGLQQALYLASSQVLSSGKNVLEIDHLIGAIMDLPESFCVYYIMEQGVTKRDLLFELCHLEDEVQYKEAIGEEGQDEDEEPEQEVGSSTGIGKKL